MNKNKKQKYLLICCLAFFGVFVSGFSSQEVFADVYSTSMTTSGTVVIDVSASGRGANVGTDNIVVNSTCPLGYTLSIGGSEDNTLYKDGDSSSSEMILASSGTSESPKPIVGDDGNGNSYMNTWGYTMTSNANYASSFIGLTNTLTELTTKGSASTAGGDEVSVYFGVSVDSSIETGIYKMADGAAVTYYLTANPNCSTFKVEYDGNNANIGTTMSVNHTNVQENDTLNLYASNYKRAGYGFLGWSTEQIDPDANNASTLISAAASSGKIYGPNATITADASFLSHAIVSNNEQIVYLYAVWIKPVSGATLQNWTGCSSLDTGDVVALTDTRDSDVYAVARLADGNCWMIENLRIDSTADWDESKSQGFGGVFHGLANSESTHFNDTTAANSLYSIDGSTAYTIDSSTHTFESTDYTSRFFPRYNNINTASAVSDMTSANQNVYSYGNYYTWSAAAANTDFRNGRSAFSNYAEYTSICPAGWTLPKGSNTTEAFLNKNNFYQLGVAITGKTPDSGTSSPYYNTLADVLKFTAFPNNFVRSSNINSNDGSTVGIRGNTSIYWSNWVSSSTSDDKTPVASYAQVNPDASAAYIANSGTSSLYAGLAVRCLMGGTYTIDYDANGGSGTMSSQTGFFDNIITLSDNGFTAPTDMTFDGWNTEADGSGTSYTEQQEVVDLTVAGDSITLYAQWKSTFSCNPSGTTITTIVCMQDITSSNKASVLSSMTTNDQYQLYDSRDRKQYYVAKLADGNIWMTQNLDHDIVSTDGFYTYDNTDIGHGSVLDTNATWTGVATHSTSDTAWGNSSNNPYSYDPGNLCWDGTVISTSSGTLNNRTSTCTDNSDLHYHIGNYYNWTAAVATTNSNQYSNGTDTDRSICPAGWTLPKGGSDYTGSGSFSYLVSQVGLTGGTNGNMHTDPTYFVYGGSLTGNANQGTVSQVGYSNFYWSSVLKTKGGSSYGLFGTAYNGGSLSSIGENISGYGSFVRCLVR